ncbi:hypothetical protein RRG08_019538 [Elysia crispata]|uniref:Uncharacterized protein n=1 Tax=Elysia crispata TaxID=231223 RepID=A0AAE0YWY5_9GAST|nr:hypothetical protein RRG08_019538 [Elysia crispata]
MIGRAERLTGSDDQIVLRVYGDVENRNNTDDQCHFEGETEGKGWGAITVFHLRVSMRFRRSLKLRVYQRNFSAPARRLEI